MNAPKRESQRKRGYPHIATVMRVLSTLTEPGAFIQGGDVPWRKEHCTLSRKDILNSTQSNKLGWRAGLVRPAINQNVTLCTCSQNKWFRGPLMDKAC